MARASEKLKWMDVARREMAKAPAQNALATFKPPAPVMLSDVPEASRAAFQALPAEKRLSLSCTLHNPAITKEIRRLAALEAAAVNPRLTWTERNINERGAASARNSLRSRGVPISPMSDTTITITPASIAEELVTVERGMHSMRRSVASLPNGAARQIASDRLAVLERDRDRLMRALRAAKGTCRVE